MLKSSLCQCIDGYVLAKITITVNNTAAADIYANNANKKVTFNNCAPFIDCKSEINNVEINNAKEKVIPMYDLLEYSDNHLKTSEI